MHIQAYGDRWASQVLYMYFTDKRGTHADPKRLKAKTSCAGPGQGPRFGCTQQLPPLSTPYNACEIEIESQFQKLLLKMEVDQRGFKD